MPTEIEHINQKEVLDKPKFNNLSGLTDYLDRILKKYGKNKPFNLKTLVELKWPAKVAQLPLNSKPENIGKMIVIEKLNPDYGPFFISIEDKSQKDSTESIRQQYIIEPKFGANNEEFSLFKLVDQKGFKFIEIKNLKSDLEHFKSIFSSISQFDHLQIII